MKATEHFKQTIKTYLDERAKNDELFAVSYAKENKNMDDCATFILNQVKRSKCMGLTDEEVYSLAVHFFDEDDSVASTAWRTASVLVPEDKKSDLVKILVTQLGRGDGDTQFGLTRFLCTIGDPIVKPLEEASKSDNENVRVHAEITLIRFKELQLEFKKLQSN